MHSNLLYSAIVPGYEISLATLDGRIPHNGHVTLTYGDRDAVGHRIYIQVRAEHGVDLKDRSVKAVADAIEAAAMALFHQYVAPLGRADDPVYRTLYLDKQIQDQLKHRTMGDEPIALVRPQLQVSDSQ